MIYIPDINHEVPEVPDHCYHETVDGIEVYVSKEAAVGAGHVTFVMRGVWLFKRITVKGISYPRI